MPRPIVLVRIDRNSRITVLQGEGFAAIYLLDERSDPHAVLLPERNQMDEILDAVASSPLISVRQDDAARTARSAVDRLDGREIVVAGFADPAITSRPMRAKEST
jgi:hypothetical protein